jgi:ubiquinone/menaquinone biosynthesis C-methylase UbiE
MSSGKEALADRLARLGGGPKQWNTVAPGWARQRSYLWNVSRSVGERLVAALDPEPGETILELAAGPGDTGFEAASRVAPDGILISTDVAPDMVAAAHERGRELGLANVEYRVVDAEAIDLPDGSIDGILCRWGFMLVPQPARAFGESFRVLRPGGRMAFSVWAEPDVNPWGTAVGRALLGLGLIERPDPHAPGPFRLGDPARVRELVLAAGFDEPVLEDVHVTFEHESFDDYWEVTSDLSFLVTTAQATLETDVIDEVRSRTAESLLPHTDAKGRLTIPGLTRNVLARKPG